MSKTVSVDHLAEEIMSGLREYCELTSDQVKSAARKGANTVRNEIKANAPRLSGKYAESWRASKTEEYAHRITYTVYSPKRYMLAHLLENGHHIRLVRNGPSVGWVDEIPHIGPAEKKGIEKFETEIEKALRSV